MRNIKLTNKEYCSLVWYLSGVLGIMKNEDVKKILDNKIFGCKQTSR